MINYKKNFLLILLCGCLFFNPMMAEAKNMQPNEYTSTGMLSGPFKEICPWYSDIYYIFYKDVVETMPKGVKNDGTYKYVYDSLGQVVEKTGKNFVGKYSYSNGLLVAEVEVTKDAGGVRTENRTYSYNGENKIIKRVYSSSYLAKNSKTPTDVSYTYDMQYDGNGRLAKVLCNGQEGETFTYNHAGQLEKYTWDKEKFLFTYDAKGRVEYQQTILSSGSITKYHFFYNDLNQLIEVDEYTTEGGLIKTTDYAYDAAGNMTSKYSYFKVGNALNTSVKTGYLYYNFYDELGRLYAVYELGSTSVYGQDTPKSEQPTLKHVYYY